MEPTPLAHLAVQWLHISISLAVNFLHLSGACGSLSRWTRGHHSAFKYSMNGECPPTSIQINAPAVEPLTAGALWGERRCKSCTRASGGVTVIFRNKLVLPAFWKPYLLRGSVAAPHPATPLSPSSLSALHLCANVDARFTAPTDKENPSVTPSLGD